MKLRTLLGKPRSVFNPFARISDMALQAVGYRDNTENSGQTIPIDLAVKSALILVPVYLVFSFFVGIALENAGLQMKFYFNIWHSYLYINNGLIAGGMLILGFLLAPLQVMRVRRLNRQARRRRLGDLERMANRETAAQEDAPDMSRYTVNESPVQIVTGS